eukprot:4323861-Amphidinium_carterae.1
MSAKLFTRGPLAPVAFLRFKAFMYEYLSVWYLAVAADWLQGPYVYALYEAYGYSGQELWGLHQESLRGMPLWISWSALKSL